jgi:hypothetical protein
VDGSEQAQQYIDTIAQHADDIRSRTASPVAWYLCRQHGQLIIIWFIGADNDDDVFNNLTPMLGRWGCPHEQALETVPPAIWQAGLEGMEARLGDNGLDVVETVVVTPPEAAS